MEGFMVLKSLHWSTCVDATKPLRGGGGGPECGLGLKMDETRWNPQGPQRTRGPGGGWHVPRGPLSIFRRPNVGVDSKCQLLEIFGTLGALQ